MEEDEKFCVDLGALDAMPGTLSVQLPDYYADNMYLMIEAEDAAFSVMAPGMMAGCIPLDTLPELP